MILLNRPLRYFIRSSSTFQIRLQQSQATKQEQQSKVPAKKLLPVFKYANSYQNSIALRDSTGAYTYSNILSSARELSLEISRNLDNKTNERVLFLCPNDVNYVVTLWAIWMSGQIAVPLSPLHPQNLLLYYANDTNAKLLISTAEFSDIMTRVGKNSHTKLYVLDDKLNQNCSQKQPSNVQDLEVGLNDDFYKNSDGLILYTSGTTGNPKGVVLTHKSLTHQVNTLVEAWKWSQSDVILHTLPLHHVHGIVNALLCPLSVGAKTFMLPKFNANSVWSHLLGINADPSDRKITVYMAVPTIYSKLITEHNKLFGKDPKMKEHIRNTLKNKIRLMVSGSAPLPEPVFEKWFQVSGHRLLERYGMTEIGMCLSNYCDDTEREPGYVGMPLPGVSIKIVDKSEDERATTYLECENFEGNIITKGLEPRQDVSGELLVKGNGIFKEYFNRPESTKKAFTEDGWFKTGDMCQYSVSKKKIKMLGRRSVDIIKSGGYKISALEVETHLLGNPDIEECSVVGLPDEEWGERVAAVIVPKKEKTITLEDLKAWAEDKMPKYQVPSVVKVVEAIPKNAMGKVNKQELISSLFSK